MPGPQPGAVWPSLRENWKGRGKQAVPRGPQGMSPHLPPPPCSGLLRAELLQTHREPTTAHQLGHSHSSCS